MRTTAVHADDRPEDWEAPGAALVRSAATDRIPALADLGRVGAVRQFR
jgi:UDP-N-acetylmuramate--alanine ligase